MYFPLLAASKGKPVEITDSSGHWRPVTATEAGARAFLKGVKNVKIA